MPSGSSPQESLFHRQESSAERKQRWPERYLVARIDGGARGNPGPAGYGVVIEDESGHQVAELSEFLGQQTNNFAEYAALLAASNYALQHGLRALKVFSDSELLVRQMNGQYKVRHPMLKELHARALHLVSQLDHFQIKHVLRGKNREADRLANLAMDGGTAKKTTAGKTPESDRVAGDTNGIVRNGVVEFLGEPLPDGTLVKVRPAKSGPRP